MDEIYNDWRAAPEPPTPNATQDPQPNHQRRAITIGPDEWVDCSRWIKIMAKHNGGKVRLNYIVDISNESGLQLSADRKPAK